MAEQPPEAEAPPVVHPGDIIQITESTAPWFLCLLTVEEVHKWGVYAYTMMPAGDGLVSQRYERVAAGTFEVCGAARMLTPAVIAQRQLSIETHEALAAEIAKA